MIPYINSHYLIPDTDKFFDMLEGDLSDHVPTINIENDGIGWNEFWGHRSFDKGTDYPVLEDDEATIEYHLGLSKRALNELVKLLMMDTFKGHINVYQGPYDDEEYAVWYEIKSYSIKGHKLIVHVNWTDVEDWS